MGIWQKIKSTVKKWLGGGSKSTKATPPRTRATHSNPQARNQTQVSRGRGRIVVDVDDEKEKKRVERENVFKAVRREAKDITASFKKESAPDPKVEAAKKSRAEMRKKLDAKKQERASYHKATGNKYNTEVGTKEERARARQRIKSGEYQSDAEAEKWEVKHHPIASSAARGALSGTTFGASELMAQKSKKRKESGAEEYYQKNKNKTAEVAGEIVGSLASFGGTAGATEKAAAKLTSRVAPKAAARLAEKEVIKGVAKRSVEKAVRKGVVKEASEELIKQVGKDKAAKIVSALGADVVQNLTTGAIYDINRASAEHEVGSEDWWKELGTSAALNFGVTGAVAGVSALRGGKRLAVNAADELGKLEKAGFVTQAPDAKVSLKRRRKTNVVLPNERPASAMSEAALDDALIESATTTEDFMNIFGLDRATAEILAEDRARQAGRAAADAVSETAGNGIPKGNIKPLAENLQANDYLPRSRNAEWRAAPRSAKRVDTSIEGMTKQLDELKGQTVTTDRERRAIETKINDVTERLNRAKWRSEGGADMDAMQKAYRGEYAGFDMGKSTNSYQSDVLEGKIKGKTATIVEMSPDEYIERTYRQIFKKPSERADAFSRLAETQKNVDAYAQAMQNGEKFPLPYLDYSAAQQEGRHRALAAKAAGIDKIPVVIIDNETNPKAIIEEVSEATAKASAEMPRGGSWREALADAGDFNEFVNANAKNPDVKAFVESDGIDGLEKLWRDSRIAKNKQNIHEISLEESNEILGRSLPDSTRLEWFQNENSKIKPKLAYYIARDPDVINAGMTVAYHNYADSALGTPMPFDEWLITPQKMYRGTHGQELLSDDIFSAFTPDRRVAEKFAGKSADAHIEEITVRPIDTLGGYALSGEQEILVPREVIENARQATGAVDEAIEGYNPQAAENIREYLATPPKPRTSNLPKSHASKEENIRAFLNNEDVPFATADDAMPSTNPAQTAENELRDGMERRVRELAEQEAKNADEAAEGIRVNNVAEDEPISGNLPSGVDQIRSAYEYNNGEKIEGGTLTKWSEAWKALNEYAASHATGEKNRMSKVSITQLNAMDSEAERELRQRLADSGELNYDAIDTPELYDKIAKQMRDDADRWIKDMIEINEGGALDFRSTPEWQARVQYILGTVDPSADPASEIAYTEAFKLAQNISSKGGQVLNLRRNFVHLTPMGKRDAILDDFINILYNSKGFQKNHPKMSSLGYFDKREYIRKILTDDEAISAGVEKLVKSKDVDEVSEAFTELMLNVNKKNPKTRFDVLQELRYLNMLGNPRTHIRNIFGSGFFAPIRQISNAIRAGIEEPITRYASNQAGVNLQTVKHGGISLGAAKEAWAKNPKTEAGKAAKEAFDNVKAEMLGSLKYENQMYTGRGKTVAGKMLDTLSDFNSHLLSKEDDFFKEKAFRENYIKSYNRYLKDGKPITDKIKKRIEQAAMEEAQIATFNEYNELAKFLANITRKASDANASTFQRWGGRVVNAVMPFTKVPANLMKQSMNYSPIGIAKGFAGIKDAARHGDAKALTKAIDELASGLTGTGIFALGVLLGKTTHNMFGFNTEFTTNAGKNAPDAKFKKDRGMQNYSVTFTDPETGQGTSITLDWLVPTSAVFFSGVELANQLKGDDFDLMDFSGGWADIMSRLAEPVMETSMLSGLHSMLETMRGGYGGDDTKGAIHILLRETAQSYINSLVPTLLGQAARTGYKTDMQIAGDDDWEYFRNQLKSKAGLANTNILGEPLGADTDAYGNVKGEKKDFADHAKAGLKNFLSPANIQKVDFSPTDREKLRVYEEAIKNGKDPEDMAYLFPKKQYKKKFDVAGEEIKMSNRDLSTYNQAKTTGGEEGMRYILENIMFNRQTLDSTGKKVPTAEAYTKAEKAALMEKFRGKSMREVEEWLYAQPEFKKATDAEKKRAIEGLWKLTKDTKTVASQRVGEQAVYAAQGKDVNEYNFKNEISEKRRTALETAIGMGLLTYEEAVDFARNAGKTYYYENEDGGYASTYYNKKEMIEYLIEKGYSYEKAEALFNAFKNSRAKPYSGNNLSSGRRGWGRRGWRHYGHGGGGGSKAKALKQSNFKATKRTYKDTASMLKTSGSSTSRSKGLSTTSPVKIEPPTVKFKKYDV